MRRSTLLIDGISYPVVSLRAAVIGSGAAGFNAFDCLLSAGIDAALFTEDLLSGTSRNTGSDKQTYYKLSLSGVPDSVEKMAETLYQGGGVNGDTAYAEAAGSVRAFMKLCDLGVRFPVNEFGEYVGYKTDHDPVSRGTSAGPLTSKYMTEALEQSVRKKGGVIFDRFLVTGILSESDIVYGFIALNMNQLETEHRGLTIIRCPYVILCTGGPAGLYEKSVYPESQWGGSGMALAAGAEASNLSEWQYGLASVDFRWNVSGTYQQVLPRYFSVDEDGTEHEFLTEVFKSPEEALNMEFLKGYQWPFDASRVMESSHVDLAVYQESAIRHRKVYLDFRRNPDGFRPDYRYNCAEVREYLLKSGAVQDTPIERLLHMNPKAVDLYLSHGIDLRKEPLRIDLCAQHHNGGISVNSNWESTISGLFIAGEAAGNFGVKRPGGSALNATQVGSFRAAEEIRRRLERSLPKEKTEKTASLAKTSIRKIRELIISKKGEREIEAVMDDFRGRMSRDAAAFRDLGQITEREKETEDLLEKFSEKVCLNNPSDIPSLFRLRDMLEEARAVLCTMRYAGEHFGSRGSALYEKDGKTLPERINGNILVTIKKDGKYFCEERVPRPLPHPETWFENVWAAYRKREEIG